MTMFTFFTTVCRHKLSICFHTRVCFAKLRQIPDNMIFICIQNLRICIMQQKKHCPGSASCGAGGCLGAILTDLRIAYMPLFYWVSGCLCVPDKLRKILIQSKIGGVLTPLHTR